MNVESIKTTLTLQSGGTVELPDDRILCNDIRLPCDGSHTGPRLWAVGNERGCLCAVWASHEEGALDAACDAGMLAAFEVEDDDSAARLGNAGEPHDLTNAWIQPVRLSGPEDWVLIARFAEARGECAETLGR